VLPVLLYVATLGRFAFGFAKPVPVNPLRLRSYARCWGRPFADMIWVGLVGPAVNLAIAGLLVLLVLSGVLPTESRAGRVVVDLVYWVILFNLLIGLVNLLPVPPFDGSRLIIGLLPERYAIRILRHELFVLAAFIAALALAAVLAGGLVKLLLPPLTRDDYRVELEIFEGPLDLLLYLIRKDEVNIHDIPISRITEQYVEYLELMKMLDLNIAGEFILMAATLMHIKSRMLLPPAERPEEEGEPEADPRLELVRQLLEYKRFKEVAHDLHRLEVEQAATFSRHDEDRSLVAAAARPLAEVGLFDLLAAFSEVLKRAGEAPAAKEILGDEVRVADRIRDIRQLVQHSDVLRFSDLFPPGATRMEIVATFLAMLELIRLEAILAFQRQPFGPIELAAVA
jgi:segregation and condensation protein A